MRKLGMLALVAFVAVALIGCGGKLSEDKVKKVYKEAFDAQFAAMKDGKTIDSTKSYDDAAKANGFKDYKDFCEQGGKWDATKFGAALTEATKEYTARVTKYNEEKAKGGGEKEEEKKKE